MKDDCRVVIPDDRSQLLFVSDIAKNRVNVITDSCRFVKTGLRRRIQGVADDVCPETSKPDAEPTSLEPSVARHQYPAVHPKSRAHTQPLLVCTDVAQNCRDAIVSTPSFVPTSVNPTSADCELPQTIGHALCHHWSGGEL